MPTNIIDLTDTNLDDAQEPVVVEGDQEYKLRIIDCKVDTNKNGAPYILPRFEIVDEPLSKEFTKYLPLPHNEMTEKKLNTTKLNLKRFFDAVGIDPNGPINTEDLIGLEGWAILGVETDDQYGDQNYIKRFVAGA